MAKASIRDRLEKLENHQRFLVWFVTARFHATLTLEELETYISGGGFPDPIPNRPSRLDTLDRKSLLRLWEEEEQLLGGRSAEDLEYFTTNGIWPEQRGGFRYSMEEGNLIAEWRNEPEEDGIGTEKQQKET